MSCSAGVKKSRVNLRGLFEVEAGDVIRVHFIATSTRGALSLADMIKSGMVTYDNAARLTIIAALGIWGIPSNQWVEVVATETFDPTWFESQLAEHINRFQVKRR